MSLRRLGRLLGATVTAVAVAIGPGCASGGDDSPPGDSPARDATDIDGNATADGPPHTNDARPGDDSAEAPDGTPPDDSGTPPGDDALAEDSPIEVETGGDSGSPPPDTGAPAPDGVAPMDSTAPLDSTAPRDSTAPPDSTAEASPPVDSTAPDTGHADTGAGDGSTCSAGPNPTYAATCTTCAISPACLLSCASCTKQDQTQNPNPSVQLPCAGTTSVANINGVLLCQ